jgi:AraC-like DNA-binding protein
MPVSPYLLSTRPKEGVFMDPLSEVFGAMRIDKATYTRLEATAPWGFRSPGGECTGVNFVLVIRGSGLLRMKKQSESISLSGGDVFILFDDEPYTLVDHPRSKIIDCSEVEKLRVNNVIEIGGGGAPTTFVSGSFAVDALDVKPIFSVLPRFLHMRLDQNRSHSFQSILDLLATETAQPSIASEALVSRLYEALFIYAVRAYASSCIAPHGGWLAAISDKYLGEVVKAMHASMQENWSLESLAQRAGMSRSAFAARFKLVVGQTPLEYLTHWRMYKAGMLMRKHGTSLSEVAHAVGYESESAFNRVFKRSMGVTPGEFRRSHRV